MALEVIGAGWGRTGTLSLYDALETLGYRAHHMKEVFEHPEQSALFTAAARGTPDWDAIYGDYTATVDWPGAAFWRELAAAYPDAKVLLSERDANSWFESYHATIHDRIVQGGMGDWDEMVRAVILERELGGQAENRAYAIAAFERHNAEVRATIPADRLLVFQLGDGWEPLCAFLDRPVPDGPFPHLNDRASWMKEHDT